jgi:UDP-N-acetylmuramoyl-tripeptide--D-alanyl-D-alanine ligase
MKLSQCSAATGGELFNGDCSFAHLSSDSRQIRSGDLFIALRGRNFDGHEFLQLAADAGACGLVVEKRVDSIDLPQLVVQDTTRALGAIGALKRSFFRGPLIAITGSSGKTTVKGMVASILKTCGSVKATRGNFNNHIGVPLTLMTLEPVDDFAVVEMGTSSPGEIAYLAALAKPEIALVNNIMPAHIEGFGSLAGIAQEKSAIYGELGASDSAIINLDDDFSSELLQKAEGARRIGFCVGEPTKSYAEDISLVYATNITRDALGRAGFLLVSDLGQINIQLAVLGRHNIGNALAAAGCAMAAGADLDNVSRGLAAFAGEEGRMQIATAVGGATLINDTYNANPGSARAAIDYLSSCPAPRILVLGSLAALGESADQAHLKLGEYARQAGVDALFSCGEFAAQVASGFGPTGRHFKTQAELIAALKPELQPDMVVLVKGSRSARMENIISALSIQGYTASVSSHTPLSRNGQNGEQP